MATGSITAGTVVAPRRRPAVPTVADLRGARLAVTIALIVAVVGAVASVGSDAGWLAALGRIVVQRGAIPRGVPFAAAATAHWHNTLVLAELVLYAFERGFGGSGLVVLQLIAVTAGLTCLARDARAGAAGAPATAGALLLAAVGAFPSLAIVRVQLFSLALFPLLLALLRTESRCPSRRIWLALPLLAVWSNLHGAALSGLAMLVIYLAFDRYRRDRLTAVAVAVATLPALCLTPAGVGTIGYYRGLITNLAAERGVGQWAPLGHSPFDLVLVLAALMLLSRARLGLPRAWELVVVLMLGILTIKADRNGVWLMFFLVAPAAQGGQVAWARRSAVRRARTWDGLLPVGALAALVLLVLGVGHWSTAGRSSAVGRAVALAHGTPILADGLLAERVAWEGGRIWAGNPIDAFSRRVQASYLDWLAGSPSGRSALADPRITVVLVSPGSADAGLMAREHDFARTVSGAGAGALIYVRRSAASGTPA